MHTLLYIFNDLMAHVSPEKLFVGISGLVLLFCQELIKEFVHSMKIKLGFESNIQRTLKKDGIVDELLEEFTQANEPVYNVLIAKITNGGGVPKEGSPLNSCIAFPTHNRKDWPLQEVSQFWRGIIQRVYDSKHVSIPTDTIPVADHSYTYIASQKVEIVCLQVVLLKESRKYRYMMSVRLTCTPEEFILDVNLREHLRKLIINVRKQLK